MELNTPYKLLCNKKKVVELKMQLCRSSCNNCVSLDCSNAIRVSTTQTSITFLGNK